MFAKIRFVGLAICAIACVCALTTPAAAQCPAKTTVADILYNADGSLASGRVTIAWSTFVIGTCQVIAGQTTVMVANGAFSAQLYPNTTAVPSGTSYRVTFALKSGRVTTEYWVVPASAVSVALATVRAPSVPVPAMMLGEAQVTNLVSDLTKKIELPSPCSAGKMLESNGSSTPPQVNCVDPSSGSGSQHQVNGVNLASNSPVNFQNSSTIAFTNPGAGNLQASLADSAVTAAKLAVSSPSAAQLAGIGDINISAAALSPDRVVGTAVTQSRAINTTAPIAGGGDLSADRTLTCNVASGAQPGCLASADWTTFNNKVTSVSGTAEEIASTGGATPVLSIPAVLNLAGKTLKGGSPLVFEGLTVDAFEITLVVTDPTAARSFTLPNADSVAIQPLTCGGTDKVSAISALGVVTCTADAGGAGSGDNITVNAVAAVDADFDDATPAAPGGTANVKWQKDALTPNNISAYVDAAGNYTWTGTHDFNKGVSTTLGTITTDLQQIRGSVTWNQGSTAFLGRSLDVTNTTSHSASRLDRIRVGGVTQFEIYPSGIMNMATGYRVADAATTGRYLRGDGNSFTTSSVAAGGAGSCTNQFVRAAVDNATPTCATVAKADAVSTFVSNDQTNTYSTGTQDFESAAVTRPYRRLAFASFPGTCTANREFLERSDPATAGQVIYVCNAAGTGWDLVGDGTSGGSAHNLLSATHTDTVVASPVLGDVLFGNVTPAWAKLAGNITTTKKFLSQTGNATISAAPLWDTIAAADVPSLDVAKITTGVFAGARGGTNNGFMDFTGPATSLKTFTLPNASATILTTNALVTGAQGGTNNGFFDVTGPATSLKTFTFPNASATVLTSNAAVTIAQGGTGTGSTLTGLVRGSASAMTAAELSGAVTTSGSNATTLATKYATFSRDIVIFLPTTADTNLAQIYFAQAVTLTRIACSTNVGTVDIRLDKRTEAAPNTPGTEALTATLQCTTTTGTTTSFSSAGVALRIPLNLQILATATTPGVVRIHIEGTID